MAHAWILKRPSCHQNRPAGALMIIDVRRYGANVAETKSYRLNRIDNRSFLSFPQRECLNQPREVQQNDR